MPSCRHSIYWWVLQYRNVGLVVGSDDTKLNSHHIFLGYFSRGAGGGNIGGMPFEARGYFVTLFGLSVTHGRNDLSNY
jgi:hypothetical protein